MNNLILVLRDQRKYEQAEEIYRQTLGLQETALGKEHASTLTSMNNLVTVLRNHCLSAEQKKATLGLFALDIVCPHGASDADVQGWL